MHDIIDIIDYVAGAFSGPFFREGFKIAVPLLMRAGGKQGKFVGLSWLCSLLANGAPLVNLLVQGKQHLSPWENAAMYCLSVDVSVS